MADPPTDPDPDTGDGVERDRGSIAGTPRWVKVSGVVALVVVLLFVVLLLTGRGGGHGPNRHTPSSGPVSVIEPGGAGGDTTPAGRDTQP